MKTKNIRSIALTFGLLVLGVMPLTALAAVPTIVTISPSVVATGSAATTLTVNGTNFDTASAVQVNGVAIPTTYVSSAQLTATIPTTSLASAAALNISVNNPGTGGGTSGSLVFTVSANNPFPSISSISPASVVAGSGAFTLTVNGSNFNASSVVKFNGISKATTLVSGTQLHATIPAADVAMTGNHIVYVVNPAPGGGTSNSILFTIAPTTGTPQLPDTGFGPAQRAFGPAESSMANLIAAVIGILSLAGAAVVIARRARLVK